MESVPCKRWWDYRSGWSPNVPQPDHNNVLWHEGVSPRLVGMVRLFIILNHSLFSLCSNRTSSAVTKFLHSISAAHACVAGNLTNPTVLHGNGNAIPYEVGRN